MKQFRALLLSAGCLGLAGSLMAQEVANNEILIRIKPGTPEAIALATVPGRVMKRYPQIGYVLYRLPNSVRPEQGVNMARRSASVLAAEPNYKKQWYQAFTPNDALYGQQYGPQQINLPQAWFRFNGDSTTVVAVADSGCHVTHEDLAPQIIGTRSIDNSGMVDNVGHGTHCMGIATAATNNGKGIAGAGFNVKLLAIKLGDFPTTASSVEAMTYAADFGARVISCSYGGGFASPAEHAAVQYATAKECLVVAAAGNDGTTFEGYPAAFPEALAVAATDRSGQLVNFSTRGQWVDVAAPGDDILSCGTTSNSAYLSMSGTSMACPLVAGSAGLLAAYAPTATAADIRDALESTVTRIGNEIEDGRINVDAAMQVLRRPIPFDGTAVAVSVFNNDGTLLNAMSDADMLAATAANDDAMVVIRSLNRGRTGQMAALNAIVSLDPQGDELIRASATTTVSIGGGGTVTVLAFARNGQTGRYDQIGSFIASGAKVTKTFNFRSSLGTYVQGNSIDLVFRAVRPARLSRTTFTFGIDEVSVVGMKVATN